MVFSKKCVFNGIKALTVSIPLVFLAACGSSNHHSNNNNKPDLMGFMYTTTNGVGDNMVLRLSRYADGSVGNEVATVTTGLGGANPLVGGDAHGDFDSQGAIQIIGNYLLTVNAGSNDITVFKLDRATGDITQMANVDSGGTRPVSITYTKKANSDDQYWVVVGNQWNNPNIQKGGTGEPAIERYPSDAFFKDGNSNKDLSADDPMSDPQRNITLFSFDSSNGALTQAGGAPLATYPRQNGGPTDVVFSADGSKLAVSTWGVAHFATKAPELPAGEQRASRVYVYDFNTTTGAIPDAQKTKPRFFEKDGIAGTIGINWAPNSNTVIHASNFNLSTTLPDYGLTELTVGDTTVTKTQNFKTGPLGQDEACWTVLSPDNKKLYVSSFGANSITPFTLKTDGTVDKKQAFALRSTVAPNMAPPGDTKDMYVTPDNKYLYVIGAFQSFTMNRFDVTPEGLKYVNQYTFEQTEKSQKNTGVHNFLGLVGFDIKK
ncbi:beta-propeller fold lactonase family protein [Parashewanella tropica]|uniref:beta-propeller fold lactonase family protein n=1 Tax=Parashewanella tropica TaxID=2547970 RepID=UPI00105A976F|nr:beta-propeller fold lactonase family protein [Parashewanella tropica]